jgi:tetratricopeptide (TPR) repeat protein
LGRACGGSDNGDVVMSQRRPVVSEVYLPGLVPQALAVAALCAITWFFLPTAPIWAVLFIGATGYLIFCRAMRWMLVRDHTLGMVAYHAGRFEEAISHFEASHRFFSVHRRVDAWRWLLLGVASKNSYRVIALGNMAWCYGQLGDGAKAVELYERVLSEVPDHAVARATLNLLRTAGSRSNAS